MFDLGLSYCSVNIHAFRPPLDLLLVFFYYCYNKRTSSIRCYILRLVLFYSIARCQYVYGSQLVELLIHYHGVFVEIIGSYRNSGKFSCKIIFVLTDKGCLSCRRNKVPDNREILTINRFVLKREHKPTLRRNHTIL